jgi:hypothetical protein
VTLNVLLVGRLGVIVEEAQDHVRIPHVQFHVVTGPDEVRDVFSRVESIMSLWAPALTWTSALR